MVDENQTLWSMACYSNILIKLAKYQTTRITCQNLWWYFNTKATDILLNCVCYLNTNKMIGIKAFF